MNELLTTNPSSLIVIDSRVTDWKNLINDVNPNTSILVLDPARDGLTQIAEAVVDSSNIDAIHILSHGNAGSLELGSSITLNSDDLSHYQAQLSTISNALSTNGDILLYGCNVAQGEVGQQFVQQLSDLTGANIAASTNLTGAADLGGDWALEFTTGLIRATTLNVPSYAGVLAAPSISGLDPNVGFTEGNAATIIDNNIALTGGSSYGGGYLSYGLTTSNSADQLTLTSDANPNNVGAISFSAGVVYLGNGTGADPIGSIDAVENGVNGQALKINFLANFANPSFEAGSAGVGVPVTGWTIGTQQVVLGTTSIGGYVTPIDTALPSPIGTNNHTPVSASFNYQITLDGSNSPNGGGTGGTQSLQLYSSMTTAVGFDVVDGPYAQSNSFSAAAGDVLYFDWKAAGGSDAYDVFGYLLNIDDGTSTIVLNETGANASVSTPWATLNVTVPTTAHYEFVFVAGTWDATGGRAAGGSLYVDNFKVLSNSVIDTVVETIARQVAYQNTADDAPVSRTLTLTVADGTGATSTATTSMDITLTNDAPSFTAGATLAAVNENTTNPAGSDVTTLLGSHFTDPDNAYSPTDSLAGVAIVADSSSPSQGVWQYSTDGGSNWNAVGSVSTNSALLLSSSSLVRFLPTTDYSGTPGNLSVHAVDNSGALTFTSGATRATFDIANAGGISPVSASAVTLDTSITFVPTPVTLTIPATVNYTDTAFIDTFAPITGTLAATGGNLSYGITGGSDNGTTVTLANAYGTLVVTKATGSYTFTPNNAAIEPLKANPTDTDNTIQVTVSDGVQPLVSQAFTVTITQSGSTESTGDDSLAGTAGIDHWAGLTGNDTYFVNNIADSIIENLNEGTDYVSSTVSYTLGANIENLVLTGSAAINGTGNALNNQLTGNSADNVLSGGAGVDTMTGGLGNDTYGVNDTNDVVVENVGEGTDTVSSIASSYTLSANVENLILSGTVAINGTGNGLNNQITGNSANNILDGLAGADTMIGGAGDDTYTVDNTGDVVTENVGEGTDTVNSTISYTLTTDVENLILTGSGVIDGTGNALNNQITGNSADNVLSGGVGADTMTGGLGNDTYGVGDNSDVVVENAGEGIDTVFSRAVSYTLTANVENLILTPGGTGVNGTGNALNNQLTGNSADNVLSGGAGVDTMTGGLGNDTYGVNDTNDVVVENVGEGTDTVSSIASSYTLSANVENLILSGTVAINGTGNGLNNQITGNSANNILDGLAGADTMIGGAGDDTYTVDNTGDVVTENVGEGTDTVNSTISYTLTTDVENLILTGSGVIDGTGNALNNQITGNSADNVLSGGVGADTMTGGLGNDTYGVGDNSDVVVENAGEGIDTVFSRAVSYTLTANVENLILTPGGTGVNGTGNALNNQLTGNSADNVLSGGAGVDTMTGGLGNDTYGVNDTNDVVVENVGEGTDTVSSIASSYTLSANVENLILSGTAAINGTGNALNNQIIGNSADNVITGGEGADSLIGGTGKDTYNLTETTAATDTLSIATGDSLVSSYDVANSFKLGTGASPTNVGVDRLDLVSTLISTNGIGNGADVGTGANAISSHSITNGIISFDSLGAYDTPVAVTAATNLANVLSYVQANITGGSTVAFVSEGNTFVFQDGGPTDTLVELVGVTATSVSTTGAAAGSVWIA